MKDSMTIEDEKIQPEVPMATYFVPESQPAGLGLLHWIRHHLDRCTYGNKLKWEDSEKTKFKILWIHKGRRSSTDEDFKVVDDWAKYKGCQKGMKDSKIAKQNFRSALREFEGKKIRKYQKESSGSNPFMIYEFIEQTKLPAESLLHLAAAPVSGENLQLHQNLPLNNPALFLPDTTVDLDETDEQTQQNFVSHQFARESQPHLQTENSNSLETFFGINPPSSIPVLQIPETAANQSTQVQPMSVNSEQQQPLPQQQWTQPISTVIPKTVEDLRVEIGDSQH